MAVANVMTKIEEEMKESYDDSHAVTVVNFTKAQLNRFGPCICGNSSSFSGCLSIVLCQSCQRPLHGVCAGFSSLEQLQMETCNTNGAVPLCSSNRCPTCVFTRTQETNELIESRATLIITPAAILTQWEREIRRHASFATDAQDDLGCSRSLSTFVKGLKVLIYPGVRELCTQGSKFGSNADLPRIHLIHPHVLADADIVLMTFDGLMGDLGHSGDNPYVMSSQCLRTDKRYRVLPSPLTSIKWFRVCLDEAQKVETPVGGS